MVKINKSSEPAILKSNKTSWTRELMKYVSSGTKVPKDISDRYNHPEIKEVLRQECNEKCMYCESPVSHVAHEHIEHIKPKAKNKFPQLTFEWSNLGLSCPKCNMNKRDTYDASIPFVNPYVDDPNLFFVALGIMIYALQGNVRGELTHKTLELNRPELIERRKERLESISRLISSYFGTTNATLKDAIKREIEIEIADDKPYSMAAKSLYKVQFSSQIDAS